MCLNSSFLACQGVCGLSCLNKYLPIASLSKIQTCHPDLRSPSQSTCAPPCSFFLLCLLSQQPPRPFTANTSEHLGTLNVDLVCSCPLCTTSRASLPHKLLLSGHPLQPGRREETIYPQWQGQGGLDCEYFLQIGLFRK